MIYEIIVLMLGIPAGFLVAWLARDELIDGRKWFVGLVIAGVLAGFLFWLAGLTAIALTCFFAAIVSFVSYLASFEAKRKV